MQSASASGCKREAKILTVNVGGSKEALANALQADAHILLLQEHRLLGADIPGAQALASKVGWHGVWDEATKTFAKGRSGGTAVLARQPLTIHRGPRVKRATLAAVAWTRRTYIHVGSIYGAHAGHPSREEENHRLNSDLQSHLAAIGRVPWIFGGDWNMDPSLFHLGWAKGGIITHLDSPTHRLGGNLDWYLHSFWLRTGRATGHVIAGTDHTGVTVSLRADHHETLGYRLVTPTGFDADALKKIKGGSIETGPVPDVWETWSREAEKWLRKHTNDKAKGNTGRGREPVFKKQILSRPQVGAFAYRGNVTLQRLRKREGQENRLRMLEEDGKGKEAEARNLRTKVERQGRLTHREKEYIAKWAADAEHRRKSAWKKWADEQIARGGGKLYPWAQIKEPNEQLAGLEPDGGEGDKTIAKRLEEARTAWAGLWEGGRAWMRSEQVDVPPIQGEQVRYVLKRLKSGKAKGMDGWTPMELGALPPQWTDQLARFYNKRGARGLATQHPQCGGRPHREAWGQVRSPAQTDWDPLVHIQDLDGHKKEASKGLVPWPSRRGALGGRRHGVPVQGPH